MKADGMIRNLNDGDLDELLQTAEVERKRRAVASEGGLAGGQLTPSELRAFGDVGAASETRGFDVEHVFSYHPPRGEQITAYESIRTAAKYFATVLLQHTPRCADQAAALRKLRECVFTANASIALDGRQ